MSHAWRSSSRLEGVFVDASHPAMFQLWDEVVRIHPGILVALGEVGFGKVPGDCFRTVARR